MRNWEFHYYKTNSVIKAVLDETSFKVFKRKVSKLERNIPPTLPRWGPELASTQEEEDFACGLVVICPCHVASIVLEIPQQKNLTHGG